MQVDWEGLLLAWLHDPPDKALDIRRHESRAARYASCALGRSVTRDEIKHEASLADTRAAVAERIPMPTAGANGERAVGPEDGRIEIRHPVSAQGAVLDGLVVDEEGVAEAIRGIVAGLPDPRSRFLALWRLLPDRLARSLGEDFARLPADTRVPDHTLIQHADIASGIWASLQGTHGRAYLSLSLGPVQKFIEAARSVRDLWSGSAILSWLTFQGIRPVLDQLGPTALVYPALRGNPLMDLWLRDQPGLRGLVQKELVPLPSIQARRSPSIPNRFVALAPWGPDGAHARRLAGECEQAVREAWGRLAENVRDCLDPALRNLDREYPEWAHRWQEQVDGFFEIATAAMPVHGLDDDALARLMTNAGSFDDVWPEACKVRGLADAIPEADRPNYEQRSAGRWQAQLEASAKLMEAKRSVRHVPAPPLPEAGEYAAPKCSLFGSYEQMGPASLDRSREFWDKAPERIGSIRGVRLRQHERFSAVALCKRFAAPATLAGELHLDGEDLRFPDTATVAAAVWLTDAGIDPDDVRRKHQGDWNGRWLHPRADQEEPAPAAIRERIEYARKQNPPPAYYAILAMDADHMGQWLKGEYAPEVQEVLHPKMARYYRETCGEGGAAGLDAKRPVGPALHASISEALNNFASHIAPRIVEKYHGTMIYSGGDDVLALMPVRRAVACADELRRAFQGEDEGDGEGPRGWTGRTEGGAPLLVMGHRATLSAGIAFVHYMHDLRLALEAAREAEKDAKNAGRNQLTLRFMRRSGEQPHARLPWDRAPWFQEMVMKFASGATDRWAYRLRAELPTLEADELPNAAISAEIRRLVDRTRRLADRTADRADSPSTGLSGKEAAQFVGPGTPGITTDNASTGSSVLSGQEAAQWWHDYSTAVEFHASHAESHAGMGREALSSPAQRLKDFVLLCQGASFVARGHDG